MINYNFIVCINFIFLSKLEEIIFDKVTKKIYTQTNCVRTGIIDKSIFN